MINMFRRNQKIQELQILQSQAGFLEKIAEELKWIRVQMEEMRREQNEHLKQALGDNKQSDILKVFEQVKSIMVPTPEKKTGGEVDGR